MDCQESWTVGVGNGTVAGGSGGAEGVGLCWKDFGWGVVGDAVGNGGGGGGGKAGDVLAGGV